MSGDTFDLANAALDRMKRAHDRGTGCHLTAAMIENLALTFLGQTWEDSRESLPSSPGFIAKPDATAAGGEGHD